MSTPSKLELDEVIERFITVQLDNGPNDIESWGKTYRFFQNLKMEQFFHALNAMLFPMSKVDKKFRREIITAQLLNYVEENGPLL